MNHYVYKITNKLNGKIYIGVRSCRCAIDEDPYMGSGKLLKEDMRSIGEENFTKEILHIVSTREEAMDIERKLVDKKFIDRNDTYNLIIGGNDGGWKWITEDEDKLKVIRKRMSESAKVKVFSDEHRRKLSESGKQRIITEEHRKNMSEAHKGHKMPLKVAESLRQANLGRTLSEEHRKKIALANTGKKHTQKTKNIIAASNRRRGCSDETKAKIADAHKGKKLSEEHKRRISEGGKGRKDSAETRLKKSLARKGLETASSKRVMAEGRLFKFVKECAEYYGVSSTAIVNRLKSSSEKWKDFYYV